MALSHACSMDVQDRTFIIGPHGGKGDTIHVQNFTDHISDIFGMFPDADIPIPYTELLITAIPGYKRREKRAGELAPATLTSKSSPCRGHHLLGSPCHSGGSFEILLLSKLYALCGC